MSPDDTPTSCALTLLTLSVCHASPGKRRPQSVAMKPSVASIQIRPCFTSASRSHSMGKPISDRRNGSKPTFPTYSTGG